MKLGYDLKLKDIDTEIGFSFVPNGTPPQVIELMKDMESPLKIFHDGCYIDKFKLQSPVYQQLHILDWYDFAGKSYEEKLVDDYDKENYYYPISPFGTSSGFISMSGVNATNIQTQINYNFTDSISNKVLKDIEDGYCKILIDKVSEGHPYSKKWIKQLHHLLDEKGIPRNKVIYATGNNRFLDDYLLDNSFIDLTNYDNRINIIELTHYELEILLTYELVGGWDNDTECRRNKHFISLNHGEKKHRTSLIDTILNNDFSDKGYFSYVDKGIFLDIESAADREGGNETLIKWFSGLNHLYADSYFNFTTETLFHEPSIRLSEKIFKPVLYQQPFLMYSAPHMLKKFKEIGYKTFDKWFDESYDDEFDDEKRLEILNNEVSRLCSLSLDEVDKIYRESKEILDYNLNHLLNLKGRVKLPI